MSSSGEVGMTDDVSVVMASPALPPVTASTWGGTATGSATQGAAAGAGSAPTG